MDIIESHTVSPSASDPGGIESSEFFQARRNSKSLTDIVCLPTLYDHLNREIPRLRKKLFKTKGLDFIVSGPRLEQGTFPK